ncbi:uncharacterized protein (TIGR02588 family) [Brevundimonas bullata]|uniref:Uncharacterized protein (TIGR02588 family) n=1 Tax=Brevundimonas bullata TaxID=13160 RepID=A0A7W7N4K0_9CAUL|nr:hypothetical protein [Brevundimonas bullata]MBB4798332.1 uncharacterized protein (TIGR02588 family) [Brevundimonas bullata]MBB6383354.1 uncharacterized protein (TIGR02588 family) [Brevundimonas bullata]
MTGMKNRRTSDGGTSSRLQALCAFLGLIVTLAAIVVLARSAFAHQSPPDLSVRTEAPRPVASGWAVEVRVLNKGDMTAAAVEIEGESEGERAQASLDYVPGRGEKRATLVFSSSAKPQARVRVMGWSDP